MPSSFRRSFNRAGGKMAQEVVGVGMKELLAQMLETPEVKEERELKKEESRLKIKELETTAPILREYKQAQIAEREAHIAEREARTEELTARTARNKAMVDIALKKWENSKNPKEQFVYSALLEIIKSPGFHYSVVETPTLIENISQIYDLSLQKGLLPGTPSAKKPAIFKTVDEVKDARLSGQITDAQFIDEVKKRGWAE